MVDILSQSGDGIEQQKGLYLQMEAEDEDVRRPKRRPKSYGCFDVSRCERRGRRRQGQMERVETLTETAESRRIPSSANTGDVLDQLNVFVVHIYFHLLSCICIYVFIHLFIFI